MVHGLADRSNVAFDDERVVVNAGLVLAVTLGRRLGLEALIDAGVKLGERPGAWRPGRKVLSLLHAMLLGADCIDDCDVLRAANTEAILGQRAMAPSTLGTFCGPSRSGMSASSTASWDKRSAARGSWAPAPAVGGWSSMSTASSARYTAAPNAAPATATPASLATTRSLPRARTATRFCTFACVTAARTLSAVRCASSMSCLRGSERPARAARSCLEPTRGFGNKKVTAGLRAQGCEYSIGVTMHKIVSTQIALIADDAWQPVSDYPDSGVCEVAETTLGSDRLIVRRVHLHAQDEQGELFSFWRHHALITNRSEAIHDVDLEHRQHAVVELVIGDLKAQALAHFSSGNYSANSAWTVIVCLAHNLRRWTEVIALADSTPRTAATIRRRLFSIPGRLTKTARRWTLHLPARWPWQIDFLQALTRIRALPAA